MNIYAIYPTDNPEMIYVGKTKNSIQVRFYQHWQDRTKLDKCCAVGRLMKEYDSIQSFEIHLLEETTLDKSSERENYWINEISTLNIIRYKKSPKARVKPVLLNRTWAMDDYYRRREKILQKLKETVVCECGVEVRKQHLKRHQKSLNCNL